MDLTNKKIKKYPYWLSSIFSCIGNSKERHFTDTSSYFIDTMDILLFLTSSNNYDIINHNYYIFNVSVKIIAGSIYHVKLTNIKNKRLSKLLFEDNTIISIKIYL